MRSIFKAGILLLTVIILLCSCSKDKGIPPRVTEDDTLPATEAVTEEETVAATEEETQPPKEIEPIDLTVKTVPADVVIWGKLNRDDRGWFVTLGEALSVTDENDGALYTDVTRIALPETSADGIDKSTYLGATVTLEGRLAAADILRRRELCLTVNSIVMGRGAEENRLLPDGFELKLTDGNYDETQPLPDVMKPSFEEGRCVYNPYLLSKEALDVLGNGFADFYVEFVEAYLNYKEGCDCPDPLYAYMLSTVLYYECPVFEANGSYEYLRDYDPESGRITLNYRFGYDDHKALINEFFDKVNVFLRDVTPDMNELMRAKTVYHAQTTAVKYDYDALKALNMNNPFYAYSERRGVCITFANAYIHLLTQVGVDSTIVPGMMANGSAHVWSMMTVDGKNYFCDPTFETSKNEGKGYYYFGMNYTRRTADGTGVKGMSIGRYLPRSLDDVGLSDTSL